MKCIVSDLDGTLLTNYKDISQGNLEAIQKAEKHGIEFMIATGREYNSVLEIMKNHQFGADVILMNGSQYRDRNGTIIHNIPILEKQKQAIIDLVFRYNIGAMFNGVNNSYGAGNEREFYQRLKRRFAHLKEPQKTLSEILSEVYWDGLVLFDTIDGFAQFNDPVLKVELFDFADNFHEVLEELNKIGDLAIVPNGSHVIEITHISAQKGTMLEQVIRTKGYHKDEVLVMGDGFNDISMFERFPHSVAMDNANPKVKETANYITKTNNDDGVAHAITTLILQQMISK